jgi:hypothetical protein
MIAATRACTSSVSDDDRLVTVTIPVTFRQRGGPAWARCYWGYWRLRPPRPPDPLDPIEHIEHIAAVDLFVSATGARVEHGGDRAFYRPSTDHIQGRGPPRAKRRDP